MRRNPLSVGRGGWAALVVALAAAVSVLIAAGGAQAVDVGHPGATAATAVTAGVPVPAQQATTAVDNAVRGGGPLQVRMQLMPQGLRQVLTSGITVRVSANQSANGFAWVSISRAMARRLHLRTGHGRSAVLGRGTVRQVKNGTVTLHLHLSQAVVAKLKRVSDVTLTVRLQLAGVAGDWLAIDAVGLY